MAENKMIKTDRTSNEERTFVFSQHNKVVKAKNMEEALEKLKKLISKNKKK